MMSGDPFSLHPLLQQGFVELQNHNPNPTINTILPDNVSSSLPCNKPSLAANKKRRNLPGTPDPDAEVVALSPQSLMATNRFVCEICNKGFQRDQNLQLHRRGHNLPWKLKQRANKEVVKKKVYICPEKTCVHHDPSRALGDLTGIKKHFSRKHGEKKWKCEKCSKKYAVQSDWKAHSKTCGTREYKCDCGTIFSRKDSFITHRAFCDALTEEAVILSATTTNLSFGAGTSTNEPVSLGRQNTTTTPLPQGIADALQQKSRLSNLWMNNSNNLFVSSGSQMGSGNIDSLFDPSDHSLPNVGAYSSKPPGINPGLTLTPLPPHTKGSFTPATTSLSSLYSGSKSKHAEISSTTPMSATALLQKAAQMGSTRSNAALNPNPSNNPNNNPIPSFGMATSLSSASPNTSTGVNMAGMFQGVKPQQCDHEGISSMLGVDNGSGMSSSNAVCPSSRGMEMGMTRDFLGMGGGPFSSQELVKFASTVSSAMGYGPMNMKLKSPKN
ncbi:hypothetical protein MLD38_016175 [Melastoma candidum]|uniref:Uncharacterized protein n=1 Tax=Melastoma candidum TaxID=119954 RepID=A0ACB9RJV3_9MYRT|nr:hypothetical protein MLD38_016175 [Melastoma candidum]